MRNKLQKFLNQIAAKHYLHACEFIQNNESDYSADHAIAAHHAIHGQKKFYDDITESETITGYSEEWNAFLQKEKEELEITLKRLMQEVSNIEFETVGIVLKDARGCHRILTHATSEQLTKQRDKLISQQRTQPENKSSDN